MVSLNSKSHLIPTNKYFKPIPALEVYLDKYVMFGMTGLTFYSMVIDICLVKY